MAKSLHALNSSLEKLAEQMVEKPYAISGFDFVEDVQGKSFDTKPAKPGMKKNIPDGFMLENLGVLYEAVST